MLLGVFLIFCCFIYGDFLINFITEYRNQPKEARNCIKGLFGPSGQKGLVEAMRSHNQIYKELKIMK